LGNSSPSCHENVKENAKENNAMLPYPKNSEPSFQEMRARFFKEIPMNISKENRATVTINCHPNRMAIQGLGIGLLTGIVTRAAWDLGIISSATLTIKDASFAIWKTLCNLAITCSHILQYLNS
jgi:hypothetical protein